MKLGPEAPDKCDLKLRFMGEADVEVFRARVYGGSDREEEQRRVFMRALAADGVVECPAYDPWIDALDERGWAISAMEPNPDGPGRVRRWRLNASGLEALAAMDKETR